MKFIYKIIGLVVIDLLIIIWWVSQMDFGDPFDFFGYFIYIPFVFLLNIVISIVLFFFNKREYSKIFLINSKTILISFKYRDFAKAFLINSVIASIIMYFVYADGMVRYNEPTHSFFKEKIEVNIKPIEFDFHKETL